MTAVVAAGVAAGTPGVAQQAPPGHPRTAVAVSPLGIVIQRYVADVETALPVRGLSAGLGAAWIARGRDQRWASGRLMYYPGRVPLRGFAGGITAGVHSTEGDREGEGICPPVGQCVRRRSDTAPTVGVEAEYSWLVGRRRRVLVGAAVGAKRVLDDVDARVTPLAQQYGEARFVVGRAF